MDIGNQFIYNQLCECILQSHFKLNAKGKQGEN